MPNDTPKALMSHHTPPNNSKRPRPATDKQTTRSTRPQWKWVTKQAKQADHVTTNHHDKPRRDPQLCHQQPWKVNQASKIQTIWVPKKLLHAHRGSTQIWIPK